MSDRAHEFVVQTIDAYVLAAQQSFDERIKAWKFDIFEKEVNEVVGGLLARQVSLAFGVAINPPAWNMHVAPILLRCMADVYITFCWIAKDVAPRARLFIEYGLGQEKLAIEKYRESLAEEANPDPAVTAFIEAREQSLDSERNRFLIPVNLGAWNQTDTRKMAIEVDEKRFYDLVYTQFSSSVHSTWQHIWQVNLRPCNNPFHMGHRVPYAPQLPPDPHVFFNSAKYLGKTFAKFDEAVLKDKPVTEPYTAYDCQEILGLLGNSESGSS